MNDSPPQDPRRRLRELLSIPERDRTDEQWDEIIEIEITLAPGNRESDRTGERQPDKRQGANGPGRRPEQRKPAAKPPAARPEPRQQGPRPDAASDAPGETRAPDSRPPRRHMRRPRRPSETPGES